MVLCYIARRMTTVEWWRKARGRATADVAGSVSRAVFSDEERQRQWDANTTAIGQYKLLNDIAQYLWERMRGARDKGHIDYDKCFVITQIHHDMHAEMMARIERGEIGK